ncbi:MAG: hypothetical protein WB992_19765 [Bryobacteraceae bacterium]
MKATQEKKSRGRSASKTVAPGHYKSGITTEPTSESSKTGRYKKHRRQLAERKRIERPHKGLTQIQEELCYLASDILLNGGAQKDVSLMLTALLRHDWRRRSYTRPTEAGANAAVVDHGAQEYAARLVDDHHRRLASGWPAPKSKSKDGQDNPKLRTVTEMVRADILASLRQQFEDFLDDADGIEKVWLLNEVLEDVNSGIDLPEAFYYAVRSIDELYVRVPWEHKKRIEEFVGLLEKEETNARVDGGKTL